MCASLLETRYQASQLLPLAAISVSNSQILNQGPYSSFFSLKGISLNESSSFFASLDPEEKPSCSALLFNYAQENAQISLSQISLADQAYEEKGSESVLLSLVPFNYASFSSVAALGSPAILAEGLSVSAIECWSDCLLLSNEALSAVSSSF